MAVGGVGGSCPAKIVVGLANSRTPCAAHEKRRRSLADVRRIKFVFLVLLVRRGILVAEEIRWKGQFLTWTDCADVDVNDVGCGWRAVWVP